jgi:hypothetical protein
MPTHNSTPKKRRDSAAVPYVDNDRDFRDIILLGSIKAAIQLLTESNDPETDMACSVLRLARHRLETSWPTNGPKFTAQVDNG